MIQNALGERGARFFARARKSRDEQYGKKAEIKTFYKNPSDDWRAQPWLEWAPASIPHQKIRWEGYAIQVYKVPPMDEFGPKPDYDVSHITLLSPYLRRELKTILEAYGVVFEPASAKINWPLQPLFYARDKVAELKEKAEDEKVRGHLELLVDFIAHELESILDESEDLEKEGRITHALLWTLFPKGTIIVSESDKIQRGYRVISTEYLRGSGQDFAINCEYVRFDGVRYGHLHKTLLIHFFEGKRDITGLEVYPLELAADPKLVRDGLTERARRVLEFQAIHYVRYLTAEGQIAQGLDNGGSADMWGNSIHARVMIDFFHTAKRTKRQLIKPLPGYNIRYNTYKKSKAEVEVYRDDRRYCAECDRRQLEKSKRDQEKDLESRRRPNAEEQERNKAVVLSDEENLLMMSPNLDGFSLVSKFWRTFSVERISTLDLNSKALNHLVYPQRNKDLVCSLVEDHKRFANNQDDVIAGKGQGLLILLSGPPGTGKTLMAEAIADKTHSPIYYVDARDLGTRATMDENLQKVMADAAEWNALLLLDEADIYLQERSGDSLDRNEIVSIFLRRLEYFKGTMFLTTNLWETIDPAMESRIQVHLKFPRLPVALRVKIWENFLANIPDELCKLEPSEISELGRWNLNGRDIKNALKMTASWCRESGRPISFTAFEDIIAITCPKATKEEEELSEPKPNDDVLVVNGVNGANGHSHRKDMENLLDLAD